MSWAALLVLALAATSTPAAPVPADAVEFKPSKASYLIRSAQVIADPTRTLDIGRIRELETKGEAGWTAMSNLNFGFSKNRYWLKIPLVNLESDNADWSLEFGYPMIQDLRFYQFIDGREVSARKMGRLQPFGARQVDHWSFIFNLSMPKGTRSDLYVMVQSVGHMDATMRIYNHDALLSKSIRQAMGMGLYSGIILAMVLYNFFLFISIRDRNYFYYIVYALTLCLLQCTLNGTTYQFLWPNWVAWNNISAPVFAGVGYLFLGLFTKSLLDTKRLVPRLDIAVNVTIAASLLLICSSVFYYGVSTNRFTSLLQIGVPLVLFPVSLFCARLGSPVAFYYALAFGFFFLGSATLAAKFLGWVPQSFLTVYAMYLGSIAETILLSLALAARIKILKEDKLKSELEAAKSARQLAESRKKLERQQAVSALASQVAHDIKSPLAALDVVERELSQLGEGPRILVRSAVGRIRDIANSLLDMNRATAAESTSSGSDATSLSVHEAAAPHLLSSLIEPLVTEKRLQFRSRSSVEIESWLDASSYGIFAQVQPVEFKRLLSNLVNNAVESFGGNPGTVHVNLSVRDGRALVIVRDNGKGISPEVMVKLGQRGGTHGKTGGSGLGLHHARISAESWGGSLEIASEVGKGTMTTVILPQAPAPNWFVSDLALIPNRAVVILDDDTSIHQIWQGRLDALLVREHGVEVIHVSTPGEIRSWVEGNNKKAGEALYLLDYELLGYRETGLSLAEELGIGERSVLVTSRYEEVGVLEGCRKLRARMIPKGLAGLVPIQVENPVPTTTPARKRWNAVLIDDDPLVRMAWKMAAEKAGKKLWAFSTASDFLNESDIIDRATPVYVDAELADGVKGDAESLRIHDRGFGEIYLATGHEAEKFTGFTHLRGVIGKEPPWSDR